MKVKTAELSGVQLDYAVAMSVDHPVKVISGDVCSMHEDGNEWMPYEYFKPSTDWSHCGELVNPHEVAFAPHPVGRLWRACALKAPINNVIEEGETPQIAICRAVVASKLGDEVDIPDELMEVGE